MSLEKSTPYRNAWYRDLLEKEKELKEYTDEKVAQAIELPEVTSEDDGDLLAAVDGEWDKSDKLKTIMNAGVEQVGKIPMVGATGNWGLTDYPANELPSVTSADNGKVAGVVNGSWDKMDIPKSVEEFNIQFKYDPATMLDDVELTDNKTTADIKTAINNGKDVILKYTSQDDIYRLINSSATKLTFVNMTFIGSDGTTTRQSHYNSKVIVFDMTSGDTNEGQRFENFNIPNLPIPSLNETDRYLGIINGMYIAIGIDSSFNTSSTRPIQNKVIAEKAAIYFPDISSATFYNPIRMNRTNNKFEVATDIQLADVDLSIDSTTGKAKISTNIFKDYTFRYLNIYGNHLIFKLTQNNVAYKLKLTSVKYNYNETAYIVLTGFDAYTNEVIKLTAECAYSDFYSAKPEFVITRIAIPVTP